MEDEGLTQAVDVSQRCYQLLRWLEGAIRAGFVSLEHAGQYVTEVEVAEGWLSKHFHDFPAEARPSSRSGPELRRFANYFTTYLKASFDLHEAPGTRYFSDCCPQCGFEIDRPHLQPKKLIKRDKQNAKVLKRQFVQAFGEELGISLDAAAAAELADGLEHSRDVALAAYGLELRRRLEGASSGPATLALWREFAWTAQGSPIHGFKLKAADIVVAEQRLASFLANERQADWITVFRPTGPEELKLVEETGFKRWPPRLEGQPIFYPVTNERYAVEIAERWNVRDLGTGFVTRFKVKRTFMDRYEVHQVGAKWNTEWWIPAEDLEELNDNIVGEIEVVRRFGDE